MALIYWMPEYNTGIDIIDKQHRMLVDIINSLSDAHEAGKDKEELLKILEKLAIYAATHFAREEDLLSKFKYPDMDEHLAEHDDFEDTLYQFENKFKAGENDLTFNVLLFLSDWLINHISKTDQDFVSFLKVKRAV